MLYSVSVYYSQRILIKISQGKRCTGLGPGDTKHSFQILPPAPSVDQLLPETVYDSMHGVSPTSEDHLGFGVQRFYWGLVT